MSKNSHQNGHHLKIKAPV